MNFETAVIGAGDELSLFKAVWAKTEGYQEALWSLAMRYVTGAAPSVGLTTCYCSVFDRCFQSTGMQRPKPVKQCPAPAGFFSNFFVNHQAEEK